MPQMGYDMQEGTVVRWLKAEGSNVDLGEPVAEIETDKAVVEFESYASGVLQRILVAEGSTVPVGETIALVGEAAVVAPPAPAPDPEPVVEAEAATDESAPEAAAESAGLGAGASAAIPLGAASEPPAVDVQPEPAAPAAVETPPPPPARRVLATPIARQMARDAGVDLADVAGTGPGGRIVREDVAAAIAALRAAEADAAAVEVEEEPAPEPPAEEPAAESAPEAEEAAEEPVSDEEPVEAVGESEDDAEPAPEPEAEAQAVADEADEADDGDEPVAEAASDEEPEAAAEESEPAAEPEEEGDAAAVAIAVAASDDEGDVAVSVEIAVAVSDDEDDEADEEEEPEPAMTGEIIVSVPAVGEADEEAEVEAAADAADEEDAPEPEPVAQEEPAADDGLLPLSRTRQQIARVTIRSKSEKPHFYVNADVDMTAAMALRAQINEALASDGVRVTVNDMIIAASVIALRRFPKFNAYYEDGGIRMNDGVNVGVAMAVGEGLIMPAIVGADGMSLKEIARASKDLSERSQRGALSAPEYSGGTFAISNMGMLGVTSFVAIIQPPQTAVLAIGAVQKRAVVTDDDQIAVRQMMTATLSADHRIVDGAEGAMFVNEIKSLLENPLSVIL